MKKKFEFLAFAALLFLVSCELDYKIASGKSPDLTEIENPVSEDDSEMPEENEKIEAPEDERNAEDDENLGEEKNGKKNWTLLVYMSADNDLESSAISDINEMERVTLPDDVELLVLVDRSEAYDATNGNWTETRLYRIQGEEHPGTSIITSPLVECPELELSISKPCELDMGNKDTLSRILRYVRNEFSAKHYGLIIWGHGSGWRSEKQDSAEKEVTSAVRAFAIDDGSGSSMSLSQLRQGIEEGMNGEKLDFIGFDTCFGATIEVAYELSDCAVLMAGTPALVPEAGWNYAKLLEYFSDSDFTLENLGNCVQRQFEESYGAYGYACFMQIWMNKIPDFVRDFNSYSRKIASEINTTELRNKVFDVFENSCQTYCSSTYPTDFYVDVFSLIEEMSAAGFSDSYGLRDKINLMLADNWSSCGKVCSPGVFFGTLRKKGMFNVSHPEEYINGSRNSGLCKFVLDCDGYVPSSNGCGSLLDKLFYENFY